MSNTNECKVLIEAVRRYVKSDDYPKVEVICAILGIDSKSEKKENE